MLQSRVERELAAAGVTAETLPEAMAERHHVIDTILAESDVFRVRVLFGEWFAKQHGSSAEEAFDEIRDALLPGIEELAKEARRWITGQNSSLRIAGRAYGSTTLADVIHICAASARSHSRPWSRNEIGDRRKTVTSPIQPTASQGVRSANSGGDLLERSQAGR